MIQLEAVLAAAALCAAVYAGTRLWSSRASTLALAGGPVADPAGRPYVLYFSGPHCTVCRTHQEPALRSLGDVDVRQVDALEERELAERYHVYTLPTTVVVAADGRPLHVNYGYAPAGKLRTQLSQAG